MELLPSQVVNDVCLRGGGGGGQWLISRRCGSLVALVLWKINVPAVNSKLGQKNYAFKIYKYGRPSS